MTDGKYILESYCGESEPEALSTMLLLLWVSPPSTYILRAVPDGTKSPLNYYEDAFESSGGESDNVDVDCSSWFHLSFEHQSRPFYDQEGY